LEEGIALLQLLPKMTLRLWGKVGKGVSPFPKSVTPSRLCEGSPPFPPPTSPEINFLPFGISWEGVFFPFPLCHSELSLRGVSSLNRGGELTLLELHPKNINGGDSSLRSE